jgi:hypothetical protein
MRKCEIGVKHTVYTGDCYEYEVDLSDELSLEYVETDGKRKETRRDRIAFGSLEEVEAVIQALQLALDTRKKLNKE